MNDTISTEQIKCIKTMVGKLAIDESEVLVMGFTGMRTGKVSQMLRPEAVDMIRHLKGLDPDEKSADKMRKKLIGMAYERDGLGRLASREQKKDCIEKLNAWCIKYGIKHKPLNNYTIKELPGLVSQYEKVKQDLIDGL